MIKVDLKNKSLLSNRHRKQLPFAISQTLNNAAFEAREGIQRSMDKKFTIRRKWVKNQIKVVKSNKRDLKSVVYLDPNADFMADHETGTVRKPKRKLISVRTQGKGTRRNVPAVQLYKPRTFQTTERSTHFGIFRRIGSRLRALFVYVRRVVIKKRPFFVKTAEEVGIATINERFNKNLKKAMRTSRV